MALINPTSLYTGGNERLNSTPSVNFYAQLQAKKQAKEDALNQYFYNLQNKINTAGVRTQDLDGENGGINKDIENWRTGWLLNKGNIMNGGAAQQEHLMKFNGILNKIEQSKNRAKTELEIGKAKFEGKYDPTDDDLHVLDKVGKSIYDPESYKQDGVSEYGMGDLSLATPEFDADKQLKFWNAATKGVLPGKVYDEKNQRVDKASGSTFIPYAEVYNPNQIKSIANETVDLVRGDKSARKYYDKLLHNADQQTLDGYKNAFESVYGANTFTNDIEHIAASDAILRASQPQKTGEEPKSAWEMKNQAAINKIYLSDSLIRGRSKDNKPNENLVDYDILGDYNPNVVTINVGGNVIPTKNGGSETVGGENWSVVPVSDIDKRDFDLIDTPPYNINGKKVYKVRPNGDWEGASGKVISWSKVAQANLDKTSANEVKRGRTELKANTPKTGSSSTKTTKDPLGLGL